MSKKVIILSSFNENWFLKFTNFSAVIISSTHQWIKLEKKQILELYVPQSVIKILLRREKWKQL